MEEGGEEGNASPGTQRQARVAGGQRTRERVGNRGPRAEAGQNKKMP